MEQVSRFFYLSRSVVFLRWITLLRNCYRALLLMTISGSVLGSTLDSPTPCADNVVIPNVLISSHFAPYSTLFGLRGKVPSSTNITRRSQHFSVTSNVSEVVTCNQASFFFSSLIPPAPTVPPPLLQKKVKKERLIAGYRSSVTTSDFGWFL